MTRAIEVSDLHKRFGDNEVLKGIDCHVDDGQVVCVIRPTSGTIVIEGVDITHPEVDLDEVRSRIGMVFQRTACQAPTGRPLHGHRGLTAT